MTEAEVIEVARHEADARLWPWDEPIRVRCRRSLPLGRRIWRVQSNAAASGLHVIVVIDDSGRVLRANVKRF